MGIKIHTDESDRSAEIFLEGKITIETVPVFEEKLYNLINSGIKKIVLNMEKLDFIDSSGLGSFIRLKNVTGKAECDLKLIKVHKNVFSIFKFANLNTFFEIDLIDQ